MDGTCLGLMNLFLLKGVRCQDFAEILPPTSYLLEPVRMFVIMRRYTGDARSISAVRCRSL